MRAFGTGALFARQGKQSGFTNRRELVLAGWLRSARGGAGGQNQGNLSDARSWGKIRQRRGRAGGGSTNNGTAIYPHRHAGTKTHGHRRGACAPGLNGQTLTAFGAAGANHGTAALGAHAHQKTMGTLAAYDGRLICTFHEIAFFTLAGLDCWFRPPADAATEKPGIRAQLAFSVKNLGGTHASRRGDAAGFLVRLFSWPLLSVSACLCLFLRHTKVWSFLFLAGAAQVQRGRALWRTIPMTA